MIVSQNCTLCAFVRACCVESVSKFTIQIVDSSYNRLKYVEYSCRACVNIVCAFHSLHFKFMCAQKCVFLYSSGLYFRPKVTQMMIIGSLDFLRNFIFNSWYEFSPNLVKVHLIQRRNTRNHTCFYRNHHMNLIKELFATCKIHEITRVFAQIVT